MQSHIAALYLNVQTDMLHSGQQVSRCGHRRNCLRTILEMPTFNIEN
jgi:hypothetical protein